MAEEPALVLRRLRERIARDRLAVEATADLAWYFLHARGFRAERLGDAPGRESRLGKWIAEFPPGRLVDEALRLLPLLHARAAQAAKFTNLANYPRRPPRVYVYCLDADPALRAALEALGWSVRWKSNRETFGT